MPDRRYVSRSTASCAAALGTVSPSPPPSLLTALAWITPWIRSPSASARLSGLSRTAPPPSPGTKPLARASNVYVVPSGDSAPNRLSASTLPDSRFRFTPAAMLRPDSPPRRLAQARCTATSDDDCAASTARLGPLSPRWYETRLAMIARFTPVMVCWVIALPPRWWTRAA